MAGHAIADRAQEISGLMKTVAETVKPWLAKAIEPLTKKLDELERVQSTASLAKDDAIIDLRSRLDIQSRELDALRNDAQQAKIAQLDTKASAADIAALRTLIDAQATQIRELESQQATIERLEKSARDAPAAADVAALRERVEAQGKTIRELESRLVIVRGIDGKPGTDGKSVEPAEVRALIDAAVKAIPTPNDGAPGTAGSPGKDGRSIVAAKVDDDGALLLTFSDGEMKEVGKVRGADGSPGESGPRGENGERGEPGPIGPIGEKGDTGAIGARGDAGERGPVGEVGAPGERGEKGDSGLSAFAIAKASGFVGSEAEWLLTLRGKDGVAVNGKDGHSAFDIAREHGFSGSALDWLVSLHGKDGDNGASILSAIVDADGELVLTASDGVKHRAGVVKGRDGTPGENGRNGTPGDPGRDAVAIRPLPSIDDAKAYPAGSWAVHAGGSWYAEQATEPLSGRTPQKAGWTPIAVGEQKCDIALADDLRTVVVTRTTSTGITLERRFTLPVVIDRGVYTQDRDYARGDAVTRAGSYFVAKVDKPSGMPGASDDWRMLIKGAKP